MEKKQAQKTMNYPDIAAGPVSQLIEDAFYAYKHWALNDAYASLEIPSSEPLLAHTVAYADRYGHDVNQIWIAHDNPHRLAYFDSDRYRRAKYAHQGLKDDGTPDEEARWSTLPMWSDCQRKFGIMTRTGRLLRKLCPLWPDAHIAEFARKIDAALTMDDTKVYFKLEDRAWDAYNGENYVTGLGSGPLQASCMRHFGLQDAISLYDKLGVKVVSLRLSDVDEPKNIAARALLWRSPDLSSPDVTANLAFIDRIYFTKPVHLEYFQQNVAAWLKDNGHVPPDYVVIGKERQSYDYPKFTSLQGSVDFDLGDIALEYPCTPRDHAPFLDTLAFFNEDDDMLYTETHGRSCGCTILHNTDGYWPNRGIYVEDRDEHYPEDECCYNSRRDRWYHQDDVIWVDEEPWPEDECVMDVVSGDYILTRNAVELYGSYDMTSEDDPDLVEINGDYFHPRHRSWEQLLTDRHGEVYHPDALSDGDLVEITLGDSMGEYVPEPEAVFIYPTTDLGYGTDLLTKAGVYSLSYVCTEDDDLDEMKDIVRREIDSMIEACNRQKFFLFEEDRANDDGMQKVGIGPPPLPAPVGMRIVRVINELGA